MHKNSKLISPLLTRVFLITILLFLFATLLQGAKITAFTFDEPSHLAAGYAFLQQGLPALWTVPLRGHPVLYNALEALPIYVAHPHIPVKTLPGWGNDRRVFAAAFIHAVKGIPTVILASRIPTIFCSILLASVLWRGAVDSWGASAGLVAVLILCFDPLLLAHGRLATNDMAVTTLGGLYLYTTWRWSRKPTWTKTCILGILLGITLLTKATGIIYGTVGLVWSLWVSLRFPKAKAPQWLHVLVTGSVTLSIIWLAYGFSFGPTSILPQLPVPAPEHWDGTLFQAENAVKREVYAFGFKKTGRWWWYFPFAFAIKNPLPLLICMLFSLFVSAKWLKSLHPNQHKLDPSLKNFRFAGIILIPLFCLAYTGAALIAGPNIGYRHFLPIHPAFYLFIAGACSLSWSKLSRLGRLLLLGLGAWYILGTAAIYPHEISFFNELVGGADQGWRYLTTSNTDWLQGWEDLYVWQQETGIHFSYAGPEGYLGLEDYGIEYTPLPPVKGTDSQLLTPWLYPPPGDYIIGSSILSGMNIDDVDNYSWFRYREPDSVIAHTLYYYKVSPEDAPTWVAQCNTPIVPLDTDVLEQGYGTRLLRLLSFDCTKGWIYPDGGQSIGHYVLHASLLTPETCQTRVYLTYPMPVDPFTADHLIHTPMAARERRDQEFPAFSVYAWSPHNLPELQLSVVPASSDSVPRDFQHTFTPTSLPTIGEAVSFLGTRHKTSSGNIEVETWWHVNKGPITRPVSIMAHLLTEDGHVLEIDDGLSMSPLLWKSGDTFVQRHTFTGDCKRNPHLWLCTGVYWPDSQDLWKMPITGENALFIPLCDMP